jgi:transcriptional regulator with XRE-family HTH domain
MGTSDSPAVARYRVRIALRAAREARNLTQSQVASAMEWSLSKVMRIESGDVNVTPNDLRPLLDFLEVRDEDAVDRLIDSARLARQERWTVDPMARRYYTPAMITFQQFEEAATSVRWYQNMFVPGPIQTEAYARALVAPSRYQPDAEIIDTRIRMRLKRAEEMLDRPDGPTYLILLDESTLLRPVGGPLVIEAQLQRIAAIMRAKRHHVRIVPLTNTDFFLYGPFAMCDLGDFADALVYVENGMTDQIIQSDDEIKQHRQVFEQMWDLSLDDRASLNRVEAAISQYHDQL